MHRLLAQYVKFENYIYFVNGIIERLNHRKLHWLIYIVYSILFIFSLKNDLYTFKHSTSIDFLYRVVGSRLMEDGKSPYYDKWQVNDSNAARYYHPIPRYSQKVNGVTVSPAFLWLNEVFADEDFCKVSVWWFWIQVSFLFLSSLLLLFSFRELWQKSILLGIFTVFFAFSRNFYLHLHSAQVYVIYGFIFCLLYWLMNSTYRRKFLFIGIIIALAASLKPYFLLILFPFLFPINKQVLKGFGVAAAILLIHALVFDQLHYWKEYSSAMREYSNEVFIMNEPSFLQIHPPTFAVADCIYPFKYPTGLPLKSAGLISAQYYLLKAGIKINDPTVFGIVTLLITLLLSHLTRKRRSPEQFIALLFLIYMIAELFTPALRKGYCVIQWSVAAVIIILSYRSNKLSAILMFIGLMINNGYIPFPQVYSGSAGEFLMLCSSLLFVLIHKKQNSALDHSA